MLRELSLDEIHLKTLDLMDYIHQFCEKNDIKYVLGYGTLIGAVRHKGFIPWDDDFDIHMQRRDFEKFCRLFMEKEHEHIKLVCRANNDGYIYGIPRICDDRYIYKSVFHKSDFIKTPEMGIFIDVYPFDNFGKDCSCAHKLVRRITTINSMYAIYVNKFSVSKNFNNLIRIPMHYILQIIYGKKYNKKVDQRIKQLINKSTDDTDRFVGQVTWEAAGKQFDKEWFSDRILVPFEDRKYWIPVGYDRILRTSYNDYMVLPPENQRVATHKYHIYYKDCE